MATATAAGRSAQAPVPVEAQPAATAKASDPKTVRKDAPAKAVAVEPKQIAAATSAPDRLPPLALAPATPTVPGSRSGQVALTKAVPEPPRRDMFAMPAGTLLTGPSTGEEPVVVSIDLSRRLLASPSRSHDPAIIVALAPPPDGQTDPIVDWILPIPDPRARAGPPLRPG